MTVRRPTDAEYEAYDGMHCWQLWRQTSDAWRCPVCDRTKRQIMRWGKRVGSNARIYGPVGWKCGLHSHHDHGTRWRGSVLICGGCNSADGAAKRMLGVAYEFSFSVDELARFVTAKINGPCVIDYEVARRVLRRARCEQ